MFAFPLEGYRTGELVTLLKIKMQCKAMGSAASAEIIPKEYIVINVSPVPQPKVTPPFSSLSILLPAGLFTERGLLNMPRTIGG